jgi:hypothetical protein
MILVAAKITRTILMLSIFALELHKNEIIPRNADGFKKSLEINTMVQLTMI